MNLQRSLADVGFKSVWVECCVQKRLSNFVGMQTLLIMLVVRMVTALQRDHTNQQYVLLTSLCCIRLIYVFSSVWREVGGLGTMFLHSTCLLAGATGNLFSHHILVVASLIVPVSWTRGLYQSVKSSSVISANVNASFCCFM